MNIQRMYLSALDLTHQMLGAAIAQDWDELVRIEKQRYEVIHAIERTKISLTINDKRRIADTISEIETENTEIMERVQCWQEHAKILLRMKA